MVTLSHNRCWTSITPWRWFFWLSFWLISTSSAHAAELRATVDRHSLASDEHVVLTLTLTNSDTRLRAQGVDPNIDLSVLTRDFHVGSPRDSHRYNLYRGQGRSTSELTVELFPKRTGALTIPAFHVDGLSTAPLQLAVQEASTAGAAPLAFARVSVNKSTVWQNEQVVAALDVYSRVELQSAQLGGEVITEPQPLDALEHRRLAVQTRSDQHAGFAYQVMHTAWAMFPTQAGDLTLQFPEVWIVAKDGTKLRLPGEQLRITVKQLPADLPLGTLVGDVQLALSPTRVGQTTHDLYAWELTLQANTAFDVLPSTLEIRPVPGLQLYVDRPQRATEETSTGLLQLARYTLTAIPLNAGSYRLPEVQLPYFDALSGQLQRAVVAGPTFEVLPSTATAAEATTASSTNNEPMTSTHDTMPAWPWIITSTCVFILWLITLFFWHKERSRKRRATRSAPELRRGNPSRPLESELLNAFVAQSLADGLREFENRYGANEMLRNTVECVQRLYYGPTKIEPSADLCTAVQQAVHLLRTRDSAAGPATDPWLPENFTPAQSSHQNR